MKLTNITIRSPYTPYAIYLRGDYALKPKPYIEVMSATSSCTECLREAFWCWMVVFAVLACAMRVSKL